MKLFTISILFLLFAALPASAQGGGTTLSVTGLQRALTSGGHVAHGGGLTVTQDLTGWLALTADLRAARSVDRDPVSLILVDSRWHERTQAEAGIGLLVAPVRVQALGAEHRLGVATGPAVRWKDESHLVAGFTVPINDRTPDWRRQQVAELTAAWEANGDAYRVEIVEYDGSRSPNYPRVADIEAGTGYGLVLDSDGVDLGWSAGLDYETRRGRLSLGARAAYTRYRDQRRIVGSHALDLSLRVGVRL